MGGTVRIAVSKSQPTTTTARRPRHRRGKAVGCRHGFSHPLIVELLEERMALNGSPMANLAASSAAQAPTNAPAPAAQTGGGTAGARSAGGEAPPISASNTPAVLLFNPHQPAGDLPADVTSGNGPPLQQGAPPRFSYNLETNITGEGDGAANEPLIAPSHSGMVTPNGVATSETVRGLPFDVNQQAATPAGIPRFSFGPQTSPRSPLENRDLPGLRPGTSPSPNNRTNPTQPPESAPGTQPVIPPANQGAQQTGDSERMIAAAQAAVESGVESEPPIGVARHALAFDLVAAELAAVMPLNQDARSVGESTADSAGLASAAAGTAARSDELAAAHDETPSAEGALISGAMLTAARGPRQDHWPLDSIRRVFQWGGPPG